MLKVISIIFCIVATLTQHLQTAELSNPMKYKLPWEIPDQNQDGYSDNQDFQRAFKNLNLTRYEISALFDTVDTSRDGKVNQKEWNEFYIAFITHFENSDTEPRDGVLSEEETKKSLEDIEEFQLVLDVSKREKYLYEIMETIHSKTQVTRVDGKIALNLYEYVFLRKSAIAWKQCAPQTGYITKSNMQTCATSIMLNKQFFEFRGSKFPDNQNHVFFHTLKQFSRADEIVADSYRFLAFISIFHKFEMFQRIKQDHLASGNLNWRELEQASRDSEGPSQKLTSEVIETVFSKLKDNIEFTGLDFKEFFILMQSLDFIYIYGQGQNGFMKPEEWTTFLKDKVIRDDILDNIDDCYIDKEEKDEKQLETDHWARQQTLLEKGHKRRFMRSRQMMKRLPESEDARKFTYQIFDLDEDQLMNGGELYLFYKFSVFFKQLTVLNIHLIYQRNIDFDLHSQVHQFELGLYKEELWQFEELQNWIKETDHQDLGFNFLEFAAWFHSNYHFIHMGQQAASSQEIPFSAYKRVLNYLGFKLHRIDIENHMRQRLEEEKIQAQKFDIEAYQRDGNYVNFKEAFRQNLVRYSKAFMMDKFFGEKPYADKPFRRS